MQFSVFKASSNAQVLLKEGVVEIKEIKKVFKKIFWKNEVVKFWDKIQQRITADVSFFMLLRVTQ